MSELRAPAVPFGPHLMPEGPANTVPSALPLGECWSGIVGEFRNRLTLFLAASTEISAALPPALAARHADMLSDMESSVAFLNTLVTWMDASLADGSQCVSELTEVMTRARALALPALGPQARVRIDPLPTTVRDRGGALECALAALITELGRRFAAASWSAPIPAKADAPEIRLRAHPGHGHLGLQVERHGGPSQGADVADQVGGGASDQGGWDGGGRLRWGQLRDSVSLPVEPAFDGTFPALRRTPLGLCRVGPDSRPWGRGAHPVQSLFACNAPWAPRTGPETIRRARPPAASGRRGTLCYPELDGVLAPWTRAPR